MKPYTSLDDILSEMPEARRSVIQQIASEMIDEVDSLDALRKAMQLTQEVLAERLGIRQGDVSKLERRADPSVATLRRCIEAMGGHLELIVNFPERPPIRLKQLGLKKQAPLKPRNAS